MMCRAPSESGARRGGVGHQDHRPVGPRRPDRLAEVFDAGVSRAHEVDGGRVGSQPEAESPIGADVPESTAPCAVRPIRWSVSGTPAAGRVSPPCSRTTRPAMLSGAWAASGDAGGAASRTQPAARLRREPAEVLGIELLEVLLEGFGVEPPFRCRRAGLGGVVVEEVIGGEDRGVQPQREGDAVGRAGVHLRPPVRRGG